MEKTALLEAFVNSIPDPVVIADTQHTVVFMNREAIAFFEGGSGLLGKSLFDCHNANSKKIMEDVLEQLKNGEEEVQITDKPAQRTYMRAIRDDGGRLLGYYERYMYWPKRVA